MVIKRDFYLDKLVRKDGNGLIKVVTGIRRSGKSFLVRNLFKDCLVAKGVPPANIVEIAFDERENKKHLNADAFYEYACSRIASGGKHYLFLDEVQLLDDFESVLNGLMSKSGVEIYVTGSNAKFLSRDIITEFRGRGDEIHVWPLGFGEFMSAYDGDWRDGLDEYAVYGGLPPVVLAKNVEDKMSLLKSLVVETYLNDIVTRNKIRKTGELGELLDVLASGIGTLTNPEKLENTFKTVKKSIISSDTITKYLGYFEDSYLVERSRRFDVKGRSYIETPSKYYFGDLGLRNARIQFRQYEKTHAMENIVYNELRRRGYEVDVGEVAVMESDATGRAVRKRLEIDFVANKGSRRYYVQSAYSLEGQGKMAQEKRSLMKTGDFFKKIIVTGDALATVYGEDGIEIMDIHDFLLNDDSLDR